MNISNRLISTAARQRAAALLKELSLEEKVRQLGCTMLVSEDTDLTAKDLSGGIGEIALLDICEEPEALAARLRDVQQYVMEHSPHRIPALFHCEALGGPVVPHTVLYPNSIGLGATFDTALVRDMANTIRTQMRATAILIPPGFGRWTKRSKRLPAPQPTSSTCWTSTPSIGSSRALPTTPG